MSEALKAFDLTGRVAVVTGGAGFLGAGFCRALAAAGANVTVSDIADDAAAEIAQALPTEAIAVATDVSNPESVAQMVEATLTKFSRLDILINGAALDPKFDSGSRNQHSSRFEDYPLELWNQSLSVNLTGAFLCSQAAASPLSDQPSGVIINICSTYGLVGPDQRIYQRKGQPAEFKPVDYSVTKAGLLGLTRYLATYFRGTSVRVNALSPGGVFKQHDQEFVKQYSSRTVLGRMAEPEELTGALLFLASDASSYMTGANLVVDGGWTAW
jgi:2-deoxy-D-gluconate 3-dehydrogenase